jgi:hypothetical protein
MNEYRDDNVRADTYRKGGSGGKIIVGILLAVVIIVGLLFATGFWSANVKEGALPSVKVSAQGGALPDVDVKSKELVVGTKATTVDVPTVETKKQTISIPVVGVKGSDEK